MEQIRECIACGVDLTGPFKPRITLTKALSEEESDGETLTVVANSWICPGCGLLHWYAEDEDLDRVLEVASAAGALDASPDAQYQRRAQMLRMLRRVRRM